MTSSSQPFTANDHDATFTHFLPSFPPSHSIAPVHFSLSVLPLPSSCSVLPLPSSSPSFPPILLLRSAFRGSQPNYRPKCHLATPPLIFAPHSLHPIPTAIPRNTPQKLKTSKNTPYFEVFSSLSRKNSPQSIHISKIIPNFVPNNTPPLPTTQIHPYTYLYICTHRRGTPRHIRQTYTPKDKWKT